ncbi:NAD-P-binding protein [Mycena maculata]|uniref:NAD-P-binding protein n=1 Tax=Mycena maculata TaxID=230809 RepID=A0AAD7NVB5_9AGAR|nr:NAD-P-binding protein [Mycena maculata]
MTSFAIKGAAFVTGAAQGMGRAIALRLAADGFNEDFPDVCDLPAKKSLLDGVKQEIVTNFQRESAVVLGDVSSETDVKEMVSNVTRNLGSLDVMVANAGIFRAAPLIETSSQDFDAILATNARGVFLCYRYAALQMIAQGRGGRIIGASSIAGRTGWPGGTAYSASKFAVRGLTQVAAHELAAHKITVNAYAPGHIATPMGEPTSDNQCGLKNSSAVQSLLGDPGSPMDVAAVVSFLASREAHWMTASLALQLTIDGGRLFS